MSVICQCANEEIQEGDADMNTLIIMIELSIIAFLMCVSMRDWKKCMKENKTSSIWRKEWQVRTGKFSIFHSKNQSKFWAEFCTLIAVVLLAIMLLENLDQIIPGNGRKAIAWVVGSAIISIIPYILAKRGYKKGR